MQVEIINLNEKEIDSFKDLFCDYCDELGIKISKDILITKIIDGLFLKYYRNDVVFIKIIMDNSSVIGFIIYQVDNDKSDWNKRPGWGFIREFFVIPSYRNNGLGTIMLNIVEEHFKSMGIEKIYLTSDANEVTKKFYIKNGYVDELEIDEDNKKPYFVKYI